MEILLNLANPASDYEEIRPRTKNLILKIVLILQILQILQILLRLANNRKLKYILPYKKRHVKFFPHLTEGHLVLQCLRFQTGQELALWFLYRTVARLTSFTGYVIIILSKCRKRQRRFRVTPIDVIAPTNLSERLANNKKGIWGHVMTLLAFRLNKSMGQFR